jgi:hypothetical protein
MSHRSESIAFDPLAVTFDKKASGSLNVLLPRGSINLPKCKPRQLRQIVMNEMVVVVQDQLVIARGLSGRAFNRVLWSEMLTFTRNLPAGREVCLSRSSRSVAGLRRRVDTGTGAGGPGSRSWLDASPYTEVS